MATGAAAARMAGGRAVCTVFQAWDLLAFVSATLLCSTLVSCGAQEQACRT